MLSRRERAASDLDEVVVALAFQDNRDLTETWLDPEAWLDPVEGSTEGLEARLRALALISPVRIVAEPEVTVEDTVEEVGLPRRDLTVGFDPRRSLTEVGDIIMTLEAGNMLPNTLAAEVDMAMNFFGDGPALGLIGTVLATNVVTNGCAE